MKPLWFPAYLTLRWRFLQLDVCILKQSQKEGLVQRRPGKAHRKAIYTSGKVKIQRRRRLISHKAVLGRAMDFHYSWEGTAPVQHKCSPALQHPPRSDIIPDSPNPNTQHKSKMLPCCSWGRWCASPRSKYKCNVLVSPPAQQWWQPSPLPKAESAVRGKQYWGPSAQNTFSPCFKCGRLVHAHNIDNAFHLPYRKKTRINHRLKIQGSQFSACFL